MRSPNYPAVKLSEAVNLAQAVWGREKRSYAPMGAIVQAWGYSSLSGNARTKIAAMRKYGLLEENDSGDMRLSDIAMNALHNAPDSPERLAALRTAALAPELFSELQQTYPQASDDTLRSYLITKKGFTDTGADSCIEAFRDAQETGKLNDMETAVATVPPIIKPPVPPVTIPASYLPQQDTAPESITTYRWPLSRGVVAEVRFVGPAKPAHLDLLKKYLDVAKGAMEVDEEQPKQPKEVPLEDQMD